MPKGKWYSSTVFINDKFALNYIIKLFILNKNVKSNLCPISTHFPKLFSTNIPRSYFCQVTILPQQK